MSNLETRLAEDLRKRNAYVITGLLAVSAILSAGLIAFYAVTGDQPRLFLTVWALIAGIVFDFLPLVMIRRNRTDLAMMLLITSTLMIALSIIFVLQGRSLFVAFVIVLILSAIAGLAMSPRYTMSVVITAVLFAAGVTALDFNLGPGRIELPDLNRYHFLFAALMVIPIVFIVLKQIPQFSLQAKITLGIMVTGGVAVSVISYFATDQAGRITNLLEGRLEANVRQLAEEQLINIAADEAGRANDFFEEIELNVTNLAGYRTSLQGQYSNLSQGAYWNASDRLIQLGGGQYGNSAQDISSVFIPSTVPLDESVISTLNVSSYLDFIAPRNLEENPSVLAIYNIDSHGVVRYYPNIELATLLPPDFDATERSYYKITAPLFNPSRSTRWAIPYVDAAGGGLVVTVAAPIYYGDAFDGVVAADVQLAIITDQLSKITVGQTGYVFMVDDAGRLIYMPPPAYELFDIDPGQLVDEEFYKYSILGEGTAELESFTSRMVAGGKGLGTIQVGGVETYISYAPLPSTGYSLALVVPLAEMQTAFASTREETSRQVRAGFQTGLVILTVTFIGAILVSILLGQLISSPVKGLTTTANRIAGGDLSARAAVVSADETGALARSFNTMADKLAGTLQGLESRIVERTRELDDANKVNSYRAARYESIARISQTISSTRQLEQLLTQITETISSQLGYYHVGIFLVDSQKEYAVLEAANSEGGRMMLARNHRLRVGETGIVGFVTHSGEPRIALDVGQDAVFFNNPDLPETHSEAALPLKSGSDIIGALDVQSKAVNAFTKEDLNILSVLADQVSIAIQNARLFQENIDAKERAERAAELLSEQQWAQFFKRKSTRGYHFDGVKIVPVEPDTKIPPAQINIPIILRGVQIGALKLSASDAGREWDAHETAMAQATAERIALAVENARLLEEAQKRASKERAIGQISSKIGNLVNLENIVQTTIQELGGTLPGTEIAIQFSSRQSS